MIKETNEPNIGQLTTEEASWLTVVVENLQYSGNREQVRKALALSDSILQKIKPSEAP